ncbi:MAG: DNA polymerase III subunit beta [Treponema sp.]|nr:DNA polymerase III subunit beta [Treponema sp.]
MKFTCDRLLLLKEISIAQEIISSKQAISVLSNIYLNAENDTLTIRSTDMKVFFETSIPVVVVEPGSTTVFGDKFFGILSTFPNDEIEFSQNDINIVIAPAASKKTSYKAETKLKCIASDKFPEFPVSRDTFFDMSIKDFKEMVQQTVFSVSDDETRFFMNGVFLEKVDDKINMVATDGRRLSFIFKHSDSNVDDFTGVIMPVKILNTIIKRAGDEGIISLSIYDKKIFINFASYKFCSVLIEGQFPNYRKVVPDNQKFTITVNRNLLLETLHRVVVMVENKNKRVYLGIKPDKMAVYTEESELGGSDFEIPCTYDGEEINIALNYRYIEDPCKAMKCDDMSIRFTEFNKAVTIVSVPEKDFFHIVMPMSP